MLENFLSQSSSQVWMPTKYPLPSENYLKKDTEKDAQHEIFFKEERCQKKYNFARKKRKITCFSWLFCEHPLTPNDEFFSFLYSINSMQKNINYQKKFSRFS